MKTPLEEYWRLLRRYLVAQRGAVALMAALILGAIALRLLAPQVVRWFIDQTQAGAAQSKLVGLALLYLAVSIVQQAFTVLGSYWSERVAWTATNSLRADLSDHLLGLDLGFHKRHTAGQMVERVDGDVNALAGFFSAFVIELVASGLLVVGVLCAFFFVSPWLGVVFVAFTVASLFVLSWVRQFAAPHWVQERQGSADFYGYVGEALSASEDLRGNGAVGYAMNRFYGTLPRWMSVHVRAELWERIVGMATIGAFAVADALGYGFGGWLFTNGTITIGAVYVVVSYIGMLGDPIDAIRTQFQDLQRADASIARIRELLAIRTNLVDGDRELPSGPLVVQFDRVWFGYADDPPAEPDDLEYVLRDVSFEVQPHRVLGIVGRTGAGKSTISALLFRLFDPQRGAVKLGGVPVRDASVEAVRRRIGLVPQDVQLFAATLRDNLTMFDPDVSDDRLRGVLDSLGLTAWLASRPGGLDTAVSATSVSAGEAQLIALARVFLKDPDVVVLDEASSRVDHATGALLEGALDRLLLGRAGLIIAHRLATLDRVDDVLVIDDGRVAEYGSRAELAADPESRFGQLLRVADSADEVSWSARPQF